MEEGRNGGLVGYSWDGRHRLKTVGTLNHVLAQAPTTLWRKVRIDVASHPGNAPRRSHCKPVHGHSSHGASGETEIVPKLKPGKILVIRWVRTKSQSAVRADDLVELVNIDGSKYDKLKHLLSA